MTTEEKLRKVLSPDDRRYDHGLKLADRIECADGLKMSVQASETHYCAPRDNYGSWYQVEVGFPTKKVEDFMEWAETPEAPTETVYGWVPLSVVVKVIDDHGGFVSAE